MKKIIIYVLITLKILAVNGSVGLIAGVQEETYIDHEKYFLVPNINLKFKYVSLNGLNLNTTIPYNNYSLNLSFEPSLFGEVLEKGEVNGKILEERDSPIYFSAKLSKNINNFTLSSFYRKEIVSEGNVLGASISYIKFFNKKYRFMIIPSIQYSYNDEKFSNYYYNFTKQESEASGLVYSQYKNTYKIEYGLATNIILNPKMNLLFAYKLDYLNSNFIREDSKKYYNSFVTGISYKF